MQRFLGLRGRNVNELPSLLSQVRFFRDSSPRTASFSPLSSIGNQNPYNSSYPKDPMIPTKLIPRNTLADEVSLGVLPLKEYQFPTVNGTSGL